MDIVVLCNHLSVEKEKSNLQSYIRNPETKLITTIRMNLKKSFRLKTTENLSDIITQFA